MTAVSSSNSLLKAEPAVSQWNQQQGSAPAATAELCVGATVRQHSVLLKD